jgi:chorismate mutase
LLPRHLKLQETIRETEEEIQVHAYERFKLIDSVSKYKEYTGSIVSEIKRKQLSETIIAVSDAYRDSFPEVLIVPITISPYAIIQDISYTNTCFV